MPWRNVWLSLSRISRKSRLLENILKQESYKEFAEISRNSRLLENILKQESYTEFAENRISGLNDTDGETDAKGSKMKFC
jgi:hypothetical protein